VRALEGLGGGAGGEVDDLFSKGHRVVETLDDRVAVAVEGEGQSVAVVAEVEGVCIPCASKLQARACQRGGSQATSEGGRTHILKAEELVAAVAAQRPGVGQQLLQRGGLGRVGVLLRDRVARCWAGRGLQRRQ
jgi:hypothetical protein